jgi:hypothetical protein
MTESEILNSLNLGSSKAILEDKPSSPLGQLLHSFSEDVIKALQEKMIARDINTSSQSLSQSAQVLPIEVSNDGVSVAITMDFYWKFVNYGVNGRLVNHGAPTYGTQPPQAKTFLQAIEEWIPKRGLMLDERHKSYPQMAKAIMFSVINKGQEARPFYTDVVNESLIKALEPKVRKVLGKAVAIMIKEPTWQ